MRIRKLQLKNGYKRFHDLTIDLGTSPARIVALVGPNGCGKSSVLDGILFHHSAHQALGKYGRRDHFYHSQNRSPNFSYENVTIEFTDGPYFPRLNARRTTGTETSMFSFRSPYRYNSSLKISETRATPEIRLNNFGASSSADLDDKMEENYRRLYAEVNRYMQDNDVAPSVARAKIIGELNASLKKCLDLEIESIGNVEASEGTLYFKKADHEKTFEFNVLSSGEKEVLDLLLDLYLRRKDYNDTIFLFDEPELHINTSIQRSLLREIDGLIGENCQIWLTTHSIGFLRILQDEMRDKCQVIQFESKFELGSKPYTLYPMKSSRANWRSLFSVALDDLAALISPQRIVYCEGRDKPGPLGAERGLDAKVYNNIFASAYPDTLFVSSGGNTELDQRSAIAITILGKVFPDLEILVLKDRDMASGKAAGEMERQQYLKLNPVNHRVLKRVEIENYLFDKEVLAQFCSANSLPFDEAQYDKLVTNIHDQDVKSLTSQIKNLCGIVISINNDTLKVNLSEFVTQAPAVFAELESCIFRRE